MAGSSTAESASCVETCLSVPGIVRQSSYFWFCGKVSASSSHVIIFCAGLAAN